MQQASSAVDANMSTPLRNNEGLNNSALQQGKAALPGAAEKSPLAKLKEKRCTSLLRLQTHDHDESQNYSTLAYGCKGENNQGGHCQQQCNPASSAAGNGGNGNGNGNRPGKGYLQIKTQNEYENYGFDTEKGGGSEAVASVKEEEMTYAKPVSQPFLIIRSPKGLNLLHYLKSRDVHAELLPQSDFRIVSSKENSRRNDEDHNDAYDYVKVQLDRAQDKRPFLDNVKYLIEGLQPSQQQQQLGSINLWEGIQNRLLLKQR
jgi:hypothetical protein